VFVHSNSDSFVNCVNTVVPEEPESPEEPFEPEDPEIPREPFDPDEPPTGGSPPLGDSRSPAWAIVMLALGALCIAGAEVYRRLVNKKAAKKS
jgi:hypothetical protein